MNLYNILITLIILCILVIVHEFGHFVVAKRVGIFVEEFAIGMGPKLFGYQGKETLFSIRAFPIGGFCKMRGEEANFDDEGNLIPTDPSVPVDLRSFEARNAGEKFLVLVAGSAMNFVYAIVCLFLAGLLAGNTNVLNAIWMALLNAWQFSGVIFQSFGMLLTGQVGLDQLAGPIGMVTMVDTFVEQGMVILMAFSAMLSVNLGILNLLPLPALDGGRIFMLLIEKVARRKLNKVTEMKINFWGFVILMALGVLIACNDIFQLIGA